MGFVMRAGHGFRLNRPIFAGRIRAAQRAKAVEALFINGFFIMSMQDSIKH